MNRRALLSALSVLSGLAALAASCAPSGFESSTKIDTVRILATRADGDESYARPGDTVTLETLTVDGRATKTPPAMTYWIPYVCQNPYNDLYYACFAPSATGDAGVASASDAGGGGGGLGAVLKPGTDLTPLLPTGPFTFTVPADIITRHSAARGTPTPYGLIIVFNIACAGHVHWKGIDPAAGPQQVPLVCVDDSGAKLGPDQYVIGFTRVFVYDTKKNANPEIDGIVLDGTETPTHVVGTALPDPVGVTLPACRGSCSSVTLDVDVPLSSWAPQPKAIWVDYYAQGGSIDAEARLLYDAKAGQITGKGSTVSYTPPDQPGPATIWAVVHDANDGVTWLQVNVTAQ